MKVRTTQPMLTLLITDLVDVEDLVLIVEAPKIEGYASLIVRASNRSWSAQVHCGTQDPLDCLTRINTARLRDALEYSRPAARHDCAMVKHMTHELAQIIPRAIEIHLGSLQAAPATQEVYR